MKRIHFCTPEKLKYIKNPETETFITVRTGFVPSVYEGDTVIITERIGRGGTRPISPCSGRK